VSEELAQVLEPPRLGRGCLVRVDAERRVNAVVRIRDLERRARGVDPGPDGDDPGDAGVSRSRDERGG
jgi:hypothetical protein